ncbi:bifunctional phosphoglucose/phosphomannose isomerase [Candidatus Saccharibacteria bacterium]|nr:MAG: bifunctional phosphoglucose/phosphomannose isomerase [Candidatus Saccharibacteria bacterium]
MLDDIDAIHKLDSDDTLGEIARFPGQLRTEIPCEPRFSATSDILNVVYAGMGGSALAALLVQTWPAMRVPFEVVRDYNLPSYIGEKTLVIIASYSGNTEETISALYEAESKGAQIAVISSGGTLSELALTRGYPLATLPKVIQPRFVVGYNYRALLGILQSADLFWGDIGELAEAADFLEEVAKELAPEVPASRNPAKQLAQKCVGKSVVMYAGHKLAPAAYKWKIGFNENAKQIAWCGLLPEFNHNEMVGWLRHPEHKPYVVIDLHSSFEHPRIRARFRVAEELLVKTRPSSFMIEAQGSSLLQQLLWASLFGDYVTVYTALLSGENPAPIDIIESFKKALDA